MTLMVNCDVCKRNMRIYQNVADDLICYKTCQECSAKEVVSNCFTTTCSICGHVNVTGGDPCIHLRPAYKEEVTTTCAIRDHVNVVLKPAYEDGGCLTNTPAPCLCTQEIRATLNLCSPEFRAALNLYCTKQPQLKDS
jgi:hypothetical protein